MSGKTRKARSTAMTGTTRTLRPVLDQPTTATIRTDTEDKLWAALHANPNSTAADLSVAARIGKSTAQKVLARWAGDGSVLRTAGIAEGGRRAADLWAIGETDTVPTDDAPADDPQRADTAHADPAKPGTTEVDDATRTQGESAEPTDAAANDAHDTTDTEPADGPATDGDGDGGETAARLAPGALRGMVEDYLRDHSREEFGPTAIAKALGGKSSGAVSNALEKLVADGTAVKTKEKPRRFALAPAEQVTTPEPAS